MKGCYSDDNCNAATMTMYRHHDPRIVPCIMDFLKTKMTQYSEKYGWVLDESDFELNDG